MIDIYYYNDTEYTDTELSIVLISNYMNKYFTDEEQKEIINNLSPTQVARLLGDKDISFFCLYYLRTMFIPSDDNSARELAPVHYEIWELLNECIELDKYDKLNIVSPRGTAKTTTCDLALSLWLICYEKSKFILLGAKKDTDASQFIDSIKKTLLDTDYIIEEFGTLIDTKKYKVNANEIEFTNDTYIRAVSSASSIRGANWKGIRPTTVIRDDFQDFADCITDEATERKYDKWCKEVEKVGDTAVFRRGKKVKKATKIISIGTVLHRNCLISRLSRNNDYHTMIKRAVVLPADTSIDEVMNNKYWLECKNIYFSRKKDSRELARAYYEENKDNMKYPLLWEEKWDFFTDVAIPYWENRQAFMSEMMNNAELIGEKWFKQVTTETTEEIESHTFTKTMLCVDPASTNTRNSDYTAILIGSKSEEGFYYVRNAILDKYTFDGYINTIIKLLYDYKDITTVYIEKNTYQGSDLLKLKEMIAEDDILKNRQIKFINEMQRKNKDNKISTIVDKVNNGAIVFRDTDTEFTGQVLSFQGQKYSYKDDAPDILSEFVNRIDKADVVQQVRFVNKGLLFN